MASVARSPPAGQQPLQRRHLGGKRSPALHVRGRWHPQARCRDRRGLPSPGQARAPRSRGHFHAHGLGELAAERMHLTVDPHEHRASERLTVDHLELVPGGDPPVGELAQHGRIGVRDPREGPAHPGVESLQALGHGLLDDQPHGSGSGPRGGRVSGLPAWPRSAPRARRRGHARAPRPRRGHDPAAPRDSGPGRARAAGGTSSATRWPDRVSVTPW